MLVVLALVAEANVGGHVRGVYLSPEAVADKSKAVAKVGIQRVAPVVIEGRVWTEAHCLVQEVWKGELEQTIVLRQAGGETPELTTKAGPRPDFKPGQKWILAVVPTKVGGWTLLGLNQGAWVLSGDKAVRDYAGFTFLQPPPVEIAEGRFERVPVPELQLKLAEPTVLAQLAEAEPNQESGRTNQTGQTNPSKTAEQASQTASQTTPAEPKSTVPPPAADRPAPFPLSILVILAILILAFLIFRRSRS